MGRDEVINTLREFIQRDPYIAFFIEFFADFGIDPLIGNQVRNPKTNTKITASPVLNKIIIEQNGKRVALPIKEAQRIIEELYGKIPLVLV